MSLGTSVEDAAVGYTLALTGGETVTLAHGSRTALIGDDAAALLAVLALEPRSALLLSDGAAPLHGAYGVGAQIAAALGGTRRAARDGATDLLEAVGVPDPHHRVTARPHQLSALDRQRTQLALALANRPGLVLAEDPAAGLSQADAAAFATAVGRLHATHRFTLVLTAPEQASCVRLVDEMLLLAGGRVAERRRRA